MPAAYTIRRGVPRNTRGSNPASTPSTCFPSFSINLFMAFPLPRGDLSSNTTNIIREQKTPSPFGCGYAALCYLHDAFPQLHRLSQLRRDPHLLGWFRCLREQDTPLSNKTREDYLLLLC